MILKDIISQCKAVEVSGPSGIAVTAVCSDSRKVIPGAAFIAVRGFAGDGHEFIASAIEKGASAVLYEDEEALREQLEGLDPSLREKVAFVRVPDSRYAVAMAADAFYGHPSRFLTLVGITGTNGKTTTVTLLYHLFTNLGYRCGHAWQHVKPAGCSALPFMPR